MFDLLQKYMLEIADFSDEQLQTIFQRFQLYTAERNEILIKRDQVARHIFFVNKGCIRTYYLLDNGNEATRAIAFETMFGTTLSSIITQEPTLEVLQAIEPCELLKISREDYYALLDLIPNWGLIYRAILERAHVTNTWRIESLLAMDAKQRYSYLLKQNPQIAQRLPNKVIASYLGISQETLSRLKSQK